MSSRFTHIRLVGGTIAAVMAATAIVLVILLTGGSSKSATAHRRVVSIGAVLSLTGAGDVYGPQQKQAAELAVDQIDAEGGIDGAKLRLIVVDDKSMPAMGKQLMRRLIVDDGVIGILGPTLSLVATAADAQASALHTPVLAVSNTANGIVGRCAYDCSWVWRDSLGEATAVPAAIRWLAQSHHVASAAIVNVADDVLGVDDAQIAAAAFAAQGIPVTSHVQVGASGPIGAQVASALHGKPAVLVIGATSGARAAQILIQARNDGFTGTVVGGNVFNSSSTAALAGSQGVGTISGAAWYAGNDFPANSNFVSAYLDRYGTDPDQFAAQAYTGIQVLADAMRIGGIGSGQRPIAAQRSALQRALAQVALLTPLGQVRFTADHDVSQTVWILRTAAGGTHELAGFCTPEC